MAGPREVIRTRINESRMIGVTPTRMVRASRVSTLTLVRPPVDRSRHTFLVDVPAASIFGHLRHQGVPLMLLSLCSRPQHESAEPLLGRSIWISRMPIRREYD